MEENTQTATDTGTQPVGKALILSGTVKATAADGTERTLAPNSPIFMDDYITTGPDGTVLMIIDENNSHLELGWLSNAFVNQDVVGGISALDVKEMAADIADIQQALKLGDIDQVLDLPVHTAGGDKSDYPDAGSGPDTLTMDDRTGEGTSAGVSSDEVAHGGIDYDSGEDQNIDDLVPPVEPTT